MPRTAAPSKRRDLLSETLHELATLRDLPLLDPSGPRQAHRHSLLRAALTGKSNVAMAAAADLLCDSDRELLALLHHSFSRLLTDPLRDDKGCIGKTAIARALERVDSDDDGVFRSGLLYTQPEPVYGGRQDTAVELRSICALGLARLSPPDVLHLLAELLSDREHGARTAAARALGCTGREGAGPLLRYKALCGDPEPSVQVECLVALCQCEGRGAIPFVKRLLESSDESKRDAAALALGQSRLPEAIPLLQDYAELPPRSHRKVALVALAMLRMPQATEYLLELVTEADSRLAVLAVEALGVQRFERSIQSRLTEICERRRDPLVSQALTRLLSE